MPFDTTREVAGACLCLYAQRAARSLARHFDEVFRPVGLTNGQFSTLNALNRAEPPAIGPVAAFLAMDRTTLTAALKSLERRGLVSIATDPEDRRSRRLSLTADGRKLLARAYPLWRDAHAALESEFGTQATGRLRAGLVRMVDRLGRDG